MTLRLKAVFAVVMVCLFFSGLAGLMYEVVWARYLALFLGHTSYAVVAVLVAFMGGLALGNVLFGALADRTTRPLVCYGWLEIGIGLFALVFPFYFGACESLFLQMARFWPDGGPLAFGVKFAGGLVTILVPTVFMGGTLPLLTRLLTRSMTDLRQNVAALYFINSAGAVAGAWLADFLLIEAIGLEATMLAGAVINLVVGTAALLLGNSLEADPVEGSPAKAAATAAASEVEPLSTPAELRLAVVGIGLSGFVAMLYQVAWTRLLALALGSSTHAFSLMLITFIAGITVGSWVIYRWRTLRDTLGAFAWIEIALAVTVAVSMFFYVYLPYWFISLAGLLARRVEAYPVYGLLQGAICFGVMFVPTVLLGMTLPLASRVATVELGRTGRSVGRVFAVNTIGTVFGAGVTGLLLLPWLGLARTFALGVVLNALIGFAILQRRRGGWPPARWATVGAVGALVVLVAGWHFDRIWPAAFNLGLWRAPEVPASARDFLDAAREAVFLYHRDGAGSTVTVQKTPETDRTNMILKVNGKTDASTMGDMRTQLLLGHLPMLLHPPAADVLVIGLGSGATAGATAAHPSLQHLDIVEISPEVAEAARLFGPWNRDVLADPRTRLVLDDAKSFLRVTPRRYDVIISEPSNPWMAGVAGVFTVEFYQSCRERLAPGGLMVQWVQLYEFSDAGFEMVVGTFGQVFPHLSVWQSQQGDLVLIGSVSPRADNLPALLSRLANPAVQQDLARAQIDNPAVLLAHQLIPADVAGYLPAPETRVHSDFYPVLEYVAQRDFFARPAAGRFRQLDETFSRRPNTLLGAYLRDHPLTEADYRAFARLYLDESRTFLDLFASILLRWQAEQPAAMEPKEMATRFRFLSAPGELEVLRLAPQRDVIVARAATDPALLRQYGTALMRHYHEQRSAFYAPPVAELTNVLGRLVGFDPANQRVYQAYLAELAWDRGDDAACIAAGEKAMAPDVERGEKRFRLDPDAAPRVAARLADAYARTGRLKYAAAFCLEFAKAGYLNDRTRPNALLFETTTRRLLAAVARQSASAGPLKAVPDTAR